MNLLLYWFCTSDENTWRRRFGFWEPETNVCYSFGHFIDQTIRQLETDSRALVVSPQICSNSCFYGTFNGQIRPDVASQSSVTVFNCLFVCSTVEKKHSGFVQFLLCWWVLSHPIWFQISSFPSAAPWNNHHQRTTFQVKPVQWWKITFLRSICFIFPDGSRWFVQWRSEKRTSAAVTRRRVLTVQNRFCDCDTRRHVLTSSVYIWNVGIISCFLAKKRNRSWVSWFCNERVYWILRRT